MFTVPSFSLTGADGSHDAAYFHKDFERMRSKLERNKQIKAQVSRRRLGKRATTSKANAVVASKTSIVVTDETSGNQDIEYYGSVSFGTPAQKFPMVWVFVAREGPLRDPTG